MPEIYRNGLNYSAALPTGGLRGQALLKNSNATGDFGWGDIKGITFTYIVGNTPLASDWLSLTDQGTALTPEDGMVYLIISEGEYYNNFVRWDVTNSLYIVISSSGASLYTGTLLSASWTNKAQTVSVQGITSTTNGIIGLLNTSTKRQFDAACEAGIRVTSLGTNSISFVCEETPSIDISFGVIVGLSGGGSSSGCYDYSTDEKVIGTWIDGKPLYQKTIVDTFGNSASDKNICSVSTFTVVNLFGMVDNARPLNVYNSSARAMLFIDDNYLKAYTEDSSYYNKQFNVTIQYTKTTD